jgi:hypothetical protein
MERTQKNGRRSSAVGTAPEQENPQYRFAVEMNRFNTKCRQIGEKIS